ncbi:MAG: LamG domain-containing protein [Cellvibrio sp.]|uniref:LamG domain-containing protein n=1 Tax=Cellvibrio sp. TaxID=1965322 RepID=UPI0031A6B978
MKFFALGFFSLCLLACSSVSNPDSQSALWVLNSTQQIAGHPVTILGEPQLVKTEIGSVVRFDGDGDRLLVDANPLGDATEFTIEIIFNPADAYPNNVEPRFFHIESADNPNRRLTIELRLNDKKQWYLDAYIKSEQSQLTLIDPTKVHPIGQWAHAAITYKKREFVSYVNGKRELVGQVDYLPIASNAKTSIGARMNQIHWFNGDIAKVKISPRALSADEFLPIQ